MKDHEVSIVVGEGATSAVIVGHGLELTEPFELAPGLTLLPGVPDFTDEQAREGCEHDYELFAVLSMRNIGTFSIEIRDDGGPERLASKTWNALWDFHLLSIGAGAPAFPLFTFSPSQDTLVFGVSNPNLLIRPLDRLAPLSSEQLNWARQAKENFEKLVGDSAFALAMRYFGNSHYLLDLESRVMLLWAGIEALLNVDSELSRRVALYAAILLDSDHDAKVEHYNLVKKAYGIRSRIVHGSSVEEGVRLEAYQTASRILAALLRKVVELGRVPSVKELDAVAVAGALTQSK